MGLDTSHNCWHGPYSAFSRWRNHVAEAAGYRIERVKDLTGFSWTTVMIDWETIERENPNCYAGEWNTEPDDPLVYLIAHSDCDGVIRPQHATRLADRLEELLPNIPEGIGMDRPRAVTERFIKGLRKAVEAGEAVDFH